MFSKENVKENKLFVTKLINRFPDLYNPKQETFRNDMCSIIWYCASFGSADMLKLLLNHANIGLNNMYRQRTALMNAVYSLNDSVEKVRLLLNAGADPNQQND